MALKSLEEIIGFNPTKRPTPTATLFAEVAADLNKERVEKAKTQAKELITKAIDLTTQRDELEKKFRKEVERFDKELGKLMGQIDQLSQGKEPQPEPEAQ